MSRLDSAKTRFTAALDKLETALAKKAASVRLDETLTRELAGLKEDRARLAAELERLNGEKVALEGFTDEVAGRLEGAIREIRAVLSH
jgi:predicted  nucleic acid-binding Zn-ribbon protein